jgi:hypothetical protein
VSLPDGTQVLTRTQTLVLFLFVVGCFLLLGWRTESSDQHIRANTERVAVESYQRCVESRARAHRLNTFSDRMAELERTNTTIDDVLRKARIDAYRGMKRLPVPTCPRP